MEILGEGVDMNDNEMQTTSDTKKKNARTMTNDVSRLVNKRKRKF